MNDKLFRELNGILKKEEQRMEMKESGCEGCAAYCATVDKEIEGIVSELNQRGFVTTQSCAGHPKGDDYCRDLDYGFGSIEFVGEYDCRYLKSLLKKLGLKNVKVGYSQRFFFPPENRLLRAWEALLHYVVSRPRTFRKRGLLPERLSYHVSDVLLALTRPFWPRKSGPRNAYATFKSVGAPELLETFKPWRFDNVESEMLGVHWEQLVCYVLPDFEFHLSRARGNWFKRLRMRSDRMYQYRVNYWLRTLETLKQSVVAAVEEGRKRSVLGFIGTDEELLEQGQVRYSELRKVFK